jgi:hypothetical protein
MFQIFPDQMIQILDDFGLFQFLINHSCVHLSQFSVNLVSGRSDRPSSGFAITPVERTPGAEKLWRSSILSSHRWVIRQKCQPYLVGGFKVWWMLLVISP